MSLLVLDLQGDVVGSGPQGLTAAEDDSCVWRGNASTAHSERSRERCNCLLLRNVQVGLGEPSKDLSVRPLETLLLPVSIGFCNHWCSIVNIGHLHFQLYPPTFSISVPQLMKKGGGCLAMMPIQKVHYKDCARHKNENTTRKNTGGIGARWLSWLGVSNNTVYLCFQERQLAQLNYLASGS